jgi:hypothetical protein
VTNEELEFALRMMRTLPPESRMDPEARWPGSRACRSRNAGRSVGP